MFNCRPGSKDNTLLPFTKRGAGGSGFVTVSPLYFARRWETISLTMEFYSVAAFDSQNAMEDEAFCLAIASKSISLRSCAVLIHATSSEIPLVSLPAVWLYRKARSEEIATGSDSPCTK